jgi:hypothetical protein
MNLSSHGPLEKRAGRRAWSWRRPPAARTRAGGCRGDRIFVDLDGRPIKRADGHALRQYYLDRDGNPVLTTDGRPRSTTSARTAGSSSRSARSRSHGQHARSRTGTPPSWSSSPRSGCSASPPASRVGVSGRREQEPSFFTVIVSRRLSALALCARVRPLQQAADGRP